ncbi:MAG TPA: protein kinase [Gemmatimonadales bacterium]|nr:protein kinase [Gemmatimonadales bacterium]
MTIERLRASLADRYHIERELGAGGMATVYLAQDLKHHRQVAIKVLKPELAAVLGAERFIHEITTTAQLQHPHILPLFDSGSADGFLYYVMPFIEGETLREKLTRETQLTITEAVRISTDVADALDYAHRHGVIHRDIKPENILLHDGRPMVADFGIALAVSAAAGGRMTETGMSLGTPHYMSPEQATADKELTGRSDIYSLGSVLYEMLTGEPPHMGNSAQQIVMKIVTEEASPVTKLRKAVPANVAAAVRTSLEKLPADRFDSAKAFAQALADPHYGEGMARREGTTLTPPVGRRSTLALGAIAVVMTVAALWGWMRGTPAAPVSRYALELGADQVPDLTGFALVTPDGSTILYAAPSSRRGVWQLWAKARDHATATPIPGTEEASAADISPDGKWLAFVKGDTIWKMPFAGGSMTPIAGGASNAAGEVAWLDDGSLVYGARTTSMYRLPPGGGPAKVLWASDSIAAFGFNALPGNRGLLYSACRLPCSTQVDLWVLDLKDLSRHLLVSDAAAGTYLGHGILVYVRADGTAMASPFSLGSLTLHGDPVPVADSVSWAGIINPYFTVSRSGTMVMQQGRNRDNPAGQLVWVDRAGKETQIDSTWIFQTTLFAGNEGMALSPDGTRLIIGLHTSTGDGIWLKQLPRGPLSRVSFGGASFRPRWAPEPGWVTFISQEGLVMRRADGTGSDSILRHGGFDEGAVSPDRHWLVVRRGAVGPVSGGRDIYGVKLGGDTAFVPLVATPYDEMAFAISPDGHWLAYQSDETGRLEVFVRPFPNTNAGKWQVSTEGGTGALWAKNGKELFYVRTADTAMVSVPVTSGATISFGATRELFRLPHTLAASVSAALVATSSRYYTPWDVAPDGRFIMTRAMGSREAQQSPLIVVENWVDEVRRKMKGH